MARRQHKQPIPQKKRPAALVSKLAAPPKANLPLTAFPTPVENEKRVLHLGWRSATPGKLPKDFQAGWREIRYDRDASVQPDMIGQIEKLDAVPDKAVEAVYMPQLLQRFPFHLITHILQEAQRVMKEGGLIAITVPNAQIAAAYVATEQASAALYPSAFGPITPVDLLYGLRAGQAKGEEQHYHRSAFTPESLGLLLRDVAFSNIHIAPRGHEIVATARRFAYDNPERVEKVTIVRGENLPKAPIVERPVAEKGELAVSKPRRAANGQGRDDELDLPPVIWKPLGLNK